MPTKTKPAKVREPKACGSCGSMATYVCECGEQIK